MSKLKLQALSIICMFAAFGLDLLSKAWAHAALEPGVRQAFIPGLLNFILVTNTGLAFSMINHNELLARFLASAVFIGLIYFYHQRYLLGSRLFYFFRVVPPDNIDAKKEILRLSLEQLGVAIIIGAAAGNLLERFVFGHVTDFIEFAFINFPVFNMADMLIDTGVGLVLISMYLAKNKTVSKKQIQKT